MAKILVIDDSHDLLELFSILLKWKGFEPKTTTSIDKAENIISEFLPDLIILDVRIGGEDGRDLCKALQKRTAREIPIILTSADPKLLTEYKECNAGAIIEKPFDVKKVIQQIDALLNKQDKF